MTQAVFPNGHTIRYVYNDPIERLTKIEKRMSAQAQPYQTLQYQYIDTPDAVARIAKSDLLDGDDQKSVSRTCFDGWGRDTKTVSGDGLGTDEYVQAKWIDGFGRVQAVSKALRGGSDCSAVTAAGGTTFTFDELDRTLTVTAPGNATTTTQYLADARTVTDAAGKCQRFVNDGLGRLIEVGEDACTGSGVITSYGYDGSDRLTSVTQGLQPTRTFRYDLAGRLTTTTHPESGTTAYRYDNNGNVIWRRDARGAEWCFGVLGASESCDGSGYDALNRPVRKMYEAAGAGWVTTPDVYNCYDGETFTGTGCGGSTLLGELGQLTGMGNSESTSEYQHDAAGRLTAYRQTVSGLGVKEFRYSYWAGGGVSEQTYPSGRSVRTCPDEMGRAKWVSGVKTASDCRSGVAVGAGEAYVTSVGYADGGGLGQWTLGNGKIGAIGYNGREQAARMRVGTGAAGDVACGASRDEWCVEFGYGATAAVNNGNIREQKIWSRKGNGSYLQLLQSYDYL